MSGDFSRLTFNPTKHYSGVRMQQGRVQLDADWNEQMDIIMHRLETEVNDFLGKSGVPAAINEGKSFKIEVKDRKLNIGAGRYYLAGKLFENEAEVDFTAQPDYPGAALPKEAGTYLAYLDGWQRHITPVEDATIKEVALNGVDTATRLKNVWQVKLEKWGADPKAWRPPEPLSTGQMQARYQPQGVALENQLYRVEIHQGGTTNQATFKWSRDNGSIVAQVEAVAGQAVTIAGARLDAHLGFAAGQWVELLTEANMLRGEPGALQQINQASGNQLILDKAPPKAPYTLVRRWDALGALKLNTPWIPLEDGIAINFSPEANLVYRPGDYWLIPSRYLTHTIEWPQAAKGQPAFQPAHGVHHYFAALAALQFDGTSWEVKQDLRHTFQAWVDGAVSKSGDTMDGSLVLRKNGAASGNLTVGGDLRLEGKITGKSDLSVSTGLSITGNLRVQGPATPENKPTDAVVTIHGSITSPAGPLKITTDLSVIGELTVGSASLQISLKAGALKATSLTLKNATLDEKGILTAKGLVVANGKIETADPVKDDPTYPVKIETDGLVKAGKLMVGDGGIHTGGSISFGGDFIGGTFRGTFVGDGSQLTDTPPWSQNHKNGDIFYKGGKVGIGTDKPEVDLQVIGIAQAKEFQGIFVGDGSRLTNIPPWLRGFQDGDIFYRGKVGIGTSEPKAELQVVGTVQANQFQGVFIGDGSQLTISQDSPGYLVPKGGIIMWSGSATNIPKGWVLCDGNNGTPNLVDKFILGGGGRSSREGGQKSIKLTENQMPPHTHNITQKPHTHAIHNARALRFTELSSSGEGTGVWAWNGATNWLTNAESTIDISIQPAGGQDPIEIIPPYYALCFIMKT